MPQRHSTLREGFFTGILGASTVAVWFLIVDTVAGAPLFTPTMLGAALFRVDPEAITPQVALLLVAGYTVFHFAAFIAVGTLAVFLLDLAERQPALLALFVVFFVVFQTGFYGMVAVLHEVRLLNGLEWYQIAIGNLLASVVMGSYLWYSHPALRSDLQDALTR